jgi:Fic family protein
MEYNWQQADWPEFKYDLTEIEDALFAYTEKSGRLSGMLAGLPEDTKTETLIDLMVSEAVKTSEIEGEYLSRQDVMSSIKNNLGMGRETLPVRDKKAKGAAALMIDVRENYQEPLTEEKLFAWHEMIMLGSRRVLIGEWRTHEEAMQVVSGAIGKEKVHYEAPPSELVPTEMKRFIQWFNATAPGKIGAIKKPVIRSAIAHLYFESIHPFEDGNGRIGRAISEKALSQGSGSPVLLSLSKAIEAKRKDYYEALQRNSRVLEITDWLHYFVAMALEAQAHAEEQIAFTLKTVKFFDRFSSQLNERQLRVVKRMLEKGVQGLERSMTAKKYMSISKTSRATATRDLQDLVEKGAFIASGAARSTRYLLRLETET